MEAKVVVPSVVVIEGRMLETNREFRNTWGLTGVSLGVSKHNCEPYEPKGNLRKEFSTELMSCTTISSAHLQSGFYGPQNTWRCILIEKFEISLYVPSVDRSDLCTVLDLPEINHLFPDILKKVLRIFNFRKSSMEVPFTRRFSVRMAAALYTKNMPNGGTRCKSIEPVP